MTNEVSHIASWTSRQLGMFTTPPNQILSLSTEADPSPAGLNNVFSDLHPASPLCDKGTTFVPASVHGVQYPTSWINRTHQSVSVMWVMIKLHCLALCKLDFCFGAHYLTSCLFAYGIQTTPIQGLSMLS